MNHAIVFTGGPGAGKTSLIAELARRGYAHMPEAGRAIIQSQMAIGGDALPWSDRRLFAEWMLCWDLRSYQTACSMNRPVMMDRGLGDVIGYLTLCGLAVPDHFWRAAKEYRYYDTVFLAPFWPEIFTQDQERKQNLAEAKATAEVMEDIYLQLGYRVVTMPFASVTERADLILRQLAPHFRTSSAPL